MPRTAVRNRTPPASSSFRKFGSPGSIGKDLPAGRSSPAVRKTGAGRLLRRPGWPGRPGPAAKWSLWLRRRRRLAVALLLCLACGIAVHQLTPAEEPRTHALAAARDLPAGTRLAAGDLKRVAVPADSTPRGMFTDPESIIGKQLASPLRQGQVPTEAQMLGPGLLVGTAPGTAAVPLRLADPSSIQLLAAGQIINVVQTQADAGAQGEVLAAAVPVLWTSAKGGSAGQWLGTGDSEGLIVVAADSEQARKLAGSSTQGKLFFVLVNGP